MPGLVSGRYEQQAKRRCVYTHGGATGSLNSSVATLAPNQSLLKMAGGKAGKDSGKVKQKAVSRSARAGLQFPVGRLESYFWRRGGSFGRERDATASGGVESSL